MKAGMLKLVPFERITFLWNHTSWYPIFSSTRKVLSASFQTLTCYHVSLQQRRKNKNFLQMYTRTMTITEVQRDYRIHSRTITSPSENKIKSKSYKYTIGWSHSPYSKKNDGIVKRMLFKSLDFTI